MNSYMLIRFQVFLHVMFFFHDFRRNEAATGTIVFVFGHATGQPLDH